jgi:hypothetical protein
MASAKPNGEFLWENPAPGLLRLAVPGCPIHEVETLPDGTVVMTRQSVSVRVKSVEQAKNLAEEATKIMRAVQGHPEASVEDGTEN